MLMIANGSLGVRAHAPRRCFSCPATADAIPAPAPSCCKHCRAKQTAQEPADRVCASEDQPDSSSPQDCPCSDHDTCPCPGGCAYCSVAKMPCAAPAGALLVSVPCLGTC